MGAATYAKRVAAYLGWQRVGYQPENRWYTSGTKAWVTEKVFSGPLDRMNSGTQKVSAWQGISAIRTTRTTGVVMTGTVTPTPNQMTPWRTQRALKSGNQWEWQPATGMMESNLMYAETAAVANEPQQTVMNRLRKVLNSG